jgi:hypothetical protein
MIADGMTTYARVLELLADGEWHEEEELREVAYFPRAWIRELQLSGESVRTHQNARLRLRLEPTR